MLKNKILKFLYKELSIINPISKKPLSIPILGIIVTLGNLIAAASIKFTIPFWIGIAIVAICGVIYFKTKKGDF